MAVISRPGKEGNATTYQGKVAAGYTNILAQEVDADIDAIFSAWNAGVDTVNIKPGAVGPAQLAPGAVTGPALAPGSVTNPALAANSVQSVNIVDGTIVGSDVAPGTLTDSLIASVAWTKLIAPFIGSVILSPGASIDAASVPALQIVANSAAAPGYDNTKPSWLLKFDYVADKYQVLRAPPPGTAFVELFSVAANGTLKTGSVDRNALAVNASNGTAVTAYSPPNFSLATPNQWTNVVTLPSLTTRGGFVSLYGNTNLAALGPTGGAVVQQRWVRDSTPLFNRSVNVACPSALSVVPLPGVNGIDTSCPAGAHTYYYQILLAAGLTVMGSGMTDSVLMAIEVG